MRLDASLSSTATGVGYQFRSDTAMLGARITTGIVQIGATGRWIAANATRPNGATGVYWSATSGETADEDFSARDLLEAAAEGGSGGSGGGLTEEQAAQLAIIAARTRLGVTVAAPFSTDGTLTQIAGDTWAIPFTGLGDLSDATKIWVAIKARSTDADDEAAIFIDTATGLLRVLGAAAGDSALGEIQVTDEPAGELTVHLDEAVTITLPAGGPPGRPFVKGIWAIKALFTGGIVRTLGTGPFILSPRVIAART